MVAAPAGKPAASGMQSAHDTGGVTTRDIELAEAINRLAG